MRELLLHVLKEFAPINHTIIDNSDDISLFIVQNVDERFIGGVKKLVKTNATKMHDEEVYVLMQNVPTRQLDFVVLVAEDVEMDAPRAHVNAFKMLRDAASRVYLLLPPPRDTTDNTDDDKLFSDNRGYVG